MTDRLALYNAALIEIGERTIASLTEEREPRRVLDEVYDSVLALCLEAGQWNFAERTVKIDSDPAIEPEFGYQYVFTKPDDFVRTTGLSASDYINDNPSSRYSDDGAYWLADVDPIYVRYVSDDVDYGMDLGSWPKSFTRFVELALAERICERITQNQSKADRLEMKLKRAKRDALAKDAMRDGTKFTPPGTWVQARLGGRVTRRYDRA